MLESDKNDELESEEIDDSNNFELEKYNIGLKITAFQKEISCNNSELNKTDINNSKKIKNCRRTERYEKHPGTIRLVFIWFFLTQIFRNYDSGSMPVLLNIISKEFLLGDIQLGILGALPYLSAMFTAFILSNPLQIYNQKWIIASSIFGLVVGIILMLASTSSIVLFIARLIIGSMQAPLSIYIPVWIDEFSPSGKLTAWMGMSQITLILGVAMGYLITGFVNKYNNGWRYSLIVPATVLSLLLLCLLFIPPEFYNVRNNYDKNTKENQGSINEISTLEQKNLSLSNKSYELSTFSTELNENSNRSNSFTIDTNNFTNISNESINYKIEMISCISKDQVIYDDSISDSDNDLYATKKAQLEIDPYYFNMEFKLDGKKKDGNKSMVKLILSWFNKWIILLSNPIYCFSAIILSVIFYTVTAVQFWTTRFLQHTYNTNDSIILMSFSTTAGTAPTAGIIVSGFLVDSIGGYKTPKGLFYTFLFCLVSSLVATLSGVLALVVDNFFATIIGIWGLLFFGAFLVPPITGISVGIVPENMRQFASTFSMVTYHIFGFAMGSLLPGAFIQFTGMNRYGMIIAYCFPCIGVIFNLTAVILSYRKYKLCEIDN